MTQKQELLQQIDVLESHLRELKSKYTEILEKIQTLKDTPELKSWEECSMGERFALFMLNNGLVEKDADLKENLIKHLASIRFVDFLLENDKETAKLIATLVDDIIKIDLDKLITKN